MSAYVYTHIWVSDIWRLIYEDLRTHMELIYESANTHIWVLNKTIICQHMSILIYEDQTYDDSYIRIYARIWNSYMSHKILIYEYLTKLSYVSMCLYSYMSIRHMTTRILVILQAYETHIWVTKYSYMSILHNPYMTTHICESYVNTHNIHMCNNI